VGNRDYRIIPVEKVPHNPALSVVESTTPASTPLPACFRRERCIRESTAGAIRTAIRVAFSHHLTSSVLPSLWPHGRSVECSPKREGGNAAWHGHTEEGRKLLKPYPFRSHRYLSYGTPSLARQKYWQIRRPQREPKNPRSATLLRPFKDYKKARQVIDAS
jgi:hypothetical protein